jgi:hypothetical protein
MTTELKRQVLNLQKQTFQHQSLQHGKASIFLTAKEAAGVDVSEVYKAAVNGLKILIQYDKRFEKFLDGLLHPSSVGVQRELKTKEVYSFFILWLDLVHWFTRKMLYLIKKLISYYHFFLYGHLKQMRI